VKKLFYYFKCELNILIVNIEKMSARHRYGQRLITIAGYVTPLTAAAIEMAGNINSTKHPTFYALFSYVKEYSLIGYLMMFLIFISGAYLSKSGNKVCWEALQVQIDELQAIAFSEHIQDGNDLHRVTLFKYKKWCFGRHRWNLKAWFKSISKGVAPNSGWLMPVLRSGHLTKNTKTVFAVPDNSADAEGVAGQCWASDYTVHVENLPSLNSASNDDNRLKYSHRTKIPIELIGEYVDNGKTLSRSLMAIPVKDDTGCRWGVVVLDSQKKTGIDKIETEKAFRTIISTLGVLVGGIK
ncbi:hypothetical protein BCV08_15815, partial [Vibrio breoganii]|uniref:hypothetical protein n=1 Tax=Vibrio breoganii TaxID=553239 RepID=UPI000CA8F456